MIDYMATFRIDLALCGFYSMFFKNIGMFSKGEPRCVSEWGSRIPTADFVVYLGPRLRWVSTTLGMYFGTVAVHRRCE